MMRISNREPMTGVSKAIAGPKAQAQPKANPAIASDRVDLSTLQPGPELVKRALQGEVKFDNGQGGISTLRLEQTGAGRYTMALDGQKVPVKLSKGVEPSRALSQMAEYLSQMPAHMWTGLKSLEVAEGGKPGNPRAAATTYGGEKVVFWNGRIPTGSFFHEIAHVHARQLFGHTDPSDVWDDAQDHDHGHVTDYAKTNDNEDFAEMFEAYFLAKRGEGQYSLAELQKKFPARMAIVEDVVAGRPVNTQDSDYWKVGGWHVPTPGHLWEQLTGPKTTRQLGDLFRSLNPFD